MRENYKLMSSLAAETRLNPGKRIEKLLRFNQRLCQVPAITQDLSHWNLELDRKLLEVDARELPAEKLYFGGKPSLPPMPITATADKGDWTRAMQNKKCVSAAPLHEWVFIITERDKGLVQVSNLY